MAGHFKIRRSCVICPLDYGRKHNSDTHRFHGVGSFCRTHATTSIGRKYCNSDGTSKHRMKKSGSYAKRMKAKRKR